LSFSEPTRATGVECNKIVQYEDRKATILSN